MNKLIPGLLVAVLSTGVMPASADHDEKGGHANCAIEELELAAEQEMHSWEITHAKHKK